MTDCIWRILPTYNAIREDHNFVHPQMFSDFHRSFDIYFDQSCNIPGGGGGGGVGGGGVSDKNVPLPLIRQKIYTCLRSKVRSPHIF